MPEGDRIVSRFIHSTAGCLALAFSCAVLALDVQVIGLTEGKAVVVIDGGKPRTLQAGQVTPDGVKLISADSQQAVFEINGKRETLTLGRSIRASSPTPEFATVTLSADARGHFITEASVNGASAKMLVDTGASLVVLSSQDAKHLGVSYLYGEKSLANTASGVAPFYRITLNTLKVGGISLNQVEAGVIEGSFPQMPLLGMSFLNRVEMRREGQNMTLRQRF
jgi:aspartyl protease family protein